MMKDPTTVAPIQNNLTNEEGHVNWKQWQADSFISLFILDVTT